MEKKWGQIKKSEGRKKREGGQRRAQEERRSGAAANGTRQRPMPQCCFGFLLLTVFTSASLLQIIHCLILPQFTKKYLIMNLIRYQPSNFCLFYPADAVTVV